MPIYILFDLGMTRSFIVMRIMKQIGEEPYMTGKWYTISTPLGKVVNVYVTYIRIRVSVNRCKTKVDLIPLQLHDYDVILGMNWLSMYKAQKNCFAKIITLQTPDGRRVVFKWEKYYTWMSDFHHYY